MKLGVTKASASSSYNGLGDQLYDLGGARPTLDLNFSSNESLVDSVTGKTLVDHTRQSSATYVDGDGVIRTAVTNLLTYSEEFDNAAWTLQTGTTVTANQATAPNGTLTADLIEGNGSNGLFSAAITVSGSSPNTKSVWLKAVTGTATVLLKDAQKTEGTTTCSLTTTWQRFSLTETQSGGICRLWITNIPAAGIYAWGAQLEQSSTVGQYVKTTTAKNGAPRFDHDPETGESLGLLVEESRTNLLVQSEDFSTTWNTARLRPFGSGSTVNATTAPNGTLTADFIQQASGQTSAGNVNVSTNTATPTVSVYAKASTKSKISILTDVGGNSETWFDLASGTVGTQKSNHTASIVSVGDGWYRCIVSSSATATFVSIYLADTDGSRTVTDSGGVYLWGAQLEAGSFPTSYIPTSGSTVTRAADVASITGSNFDSWFNAGEGVLFADFSSASATTNGYPFALDDGTASNFISIRSLQSGGNANRSINITAGGSTQASNQFSILPLDTFTKGCLAYATNDVGAVYDGGNLFTDNSATMPTVTAARIGNLVESIIMSGKIKRLTYWPTRLSNDTLQTITA
jgi:hypothetical protein